MRIEALAAALAAAAVWCVWSAPVRAGELAFFTRGNVPALLELSGGAFAAIDRDSRDSTPMFQLDAVSRWDIVNFWDYFEVRPYVGGFVTGKGGKMGYVGAQGAVPIGYHFELAPFVAIGAYDKGNGRDLGSTALFQAGVSGFYVFEGGYRAGLTFSHESNGTTLPRNRSGCICNPGSENFLISVAVPIRNLIALGE